MGLTNSAIIVIVLVACLAVTALGASLFKHYKRADRETPFSPGYEQKLYMAEVRAREFDAMTQECWAKDPESRYVPPPTYYRPHNQIEDTNTRDTGSY